MKHLLEVRDLRTSFFTPSGAVKAVGGLSFSLDRGKVLTAGGRVLCVTALGKSVGEAQAAAYRLVGKIHWPDAYCRSDIGYRAVRRNH